MSPKKTRVTIGKSVIIPIQYIHVFAQRYDKHVLPACKSLPRREREPFIIKPCHGALAPGLAWASLTHYTVRPVGRRCAGRGAVVVCATAMERGHRRKTGADVCWGVGWVALGRGRKEETSIMACLASWCVFQTHRTAASRHLSPVKQTSCFFLPVFISKRPNTQSSKVDLWLHQMSKNTLLT